MKKLILLAVIYLVVFVWGCGAPSTQPIVDDADDSVTSMMYTDILEREVVHMGFPIEYFTNGESVIRPPNYYPRRNYYVVTLGYYIRPDESLSNDQKEAETRSELLTALSDNSN